ncbi:Sulfate permease 2 [Chytriomyces hyalinus]|nr:Sulfate permease 2 [Chytriomyces hyalinus]
MSYQRVPQSQIQEIRAASNKLAKDFPQLSKQYLLGLFPIIDWLPRYNLQWLTGDFIAGITVTLVAIPQAIAYASRLALLPPEYGLYTSFIGLLVYALFATSKDVTIGTTAVLSLLVGQTVSNVLPATASVAERVIFSASLAFWTGILETLIGLFRMGIIVDFVPIPVIAGFTSGAGIQIIIGQLPALFGIKGINTNNAPYQVLGDWCRGLSAGISKYDAILGITALAFILLLKYGLDYASKKVANWLKYIGYLRNAIVLIIYTGVSFAIRNDKTIKFSVVGSIPYGLSGIMQPNVSLSYAGDVFRALPTVLIVSLLEHLAIGKTYGRLNGYTINPNQELVAIGVTNIISSFVGAYPATGSFSRSAIKSASGVRTPFASFITGVLVVISLFTLTGSMYYIPNAVLSAIIIAAIGELLSNLKVVTTLFEVELLDFVGFCIALIVTFFSNIENAIYASVAYSLLVLIVRVARPKIRVLSRAPNGAWVDESDEGYGFDSAAEVTSAPEGILVFKIDESLTYPNSSFFLTSLAAAVLERFEYAGPSVAKGDRMWNDNTETRLLERKRKGLQSLPLLRAVVFDFSAINHVDFTGLQTLLDAREDLERFAGRRVEMHFVNVRRRYLATVLRVPLASSAASIDCTPAAPGVKGTGPASFKVGNFGGILKPKANTANEEARRRDALKYFHVSVDNAILIADAQTKSVCPQDDHVEIVTAGNGDLESGEFIKSF